MTFGTPSDLTRLRRVRWFVRAVLVLGLAASVAANVLHAQPNDIARVIAAWPPLALLLTIELISRVPVHRRTRAIVRVIATGVIAVIAGWVSYWHMAGVAERYGESWDSAHLLPVSVDGLIVVASVCLVELAGRIAAAQMTSSTPDAAGTTANEPADVTRDAAEFTSPVEIETPVAEPSDVIASVMPDTATNMPPKLTPNAVEIAKVRRRNPDATQTAVAAKTGIPVRTVARHWKTTKPASDPVTETVNGRIPSLTKGAS